MTANLKCLICEEEKPLQEFMDANYAVLLGRNHHARITVSGGLFKGSEMCQACMLEVLACKARGEQWSKKKDEE